MTDQKPTGVFVRLPLSDEDKRKVFESSPYRFGFEGAFLSIGTPVTGGELAVVGWAHGLHVKDGQRFYCIRPQDKAAKIIPYYDTALVLQSDALAKLAEKDAEIARLWEALESLENANNNLCFMRSNDTYQSMMRDGCGDLLAKLDDARRAAREALKGGAA